MLQKRMLAVSSLFLALTLALSIGGFGCTTATPTPTSAPAPTTTAKPTATPAPQQIVLRGQTFYGTGHAVSLYIDYWAKELEKRTGGKVKIDYAYGEPYGKQAQVFELVSTGIIDFGILQAQYAPGKMPLEEFITGFPFHWDSAKEAAYVTYNLTKAGYFERDLTNCGPFKYLFNGQSSPYEIYLDKPIRVPEDMKGIKIRGPGGLGSRALESWGATAISMSSPEQYEALQKGVIKGTLLPAASVYSLKLYEVVKYGVDIDVLSARHPMVTRPEIWEKFSPDVKKVIENLAEEASLNAGSIYDTIGADAIKAFPKLGVELYSPTADELAKWTSAIKQLFDEEVKKLQDKGYNMTGFLNDIEKFKKEYKVKYGK